MPNKKQIKWWSLLTAIAFTVITACTNDTQTQARNTTADQDAIAALKLATGSNNTNSISIPKNPGTAQRNADGTYEMTDFIIDMELIKKTVVDQKITYTFSIMPKVVTSTSDFNLIVYNNGSGWNYSILELIRTPETSGKFQGTAKELYSSAARVSSCFTVLIEYRHCTRTGSCATGTCDRCSLCIDYDSVTFCRTEAEQYPSAELAADPDYGGGGSGVHTEPQQVDVTPEGYIFEPNIRNSTAAEIRKEHAMAFYNGLSTEQQQWARTHQDSYSSLVNYLLEHFTPAEELHTLEMIDSFVRSNGEYSGDGFTGDNDEGNPDDTGPKENIPHQIVLNDGSTVTVVFGSTESDNKSADQPVDPDLVLCVTHALNEANENLGANNKITSIYIKATSNGAHGPNSNHSKGTALDLSRINGNKIIQLGNNPQVQALQNGFDSYPNIRENFGPTFKHKSYADGTKDNSFEIAGHQDHIHVSVQSN